MTTTTTTKRGDVRFNVLERGIKKWKKTRKVQKRRIKDKKLISEKSSLENNVKELDYIESKLQKFRKGFDKKSFKEVHKIIREQLECISRLEWKLSLFGGKKVESQSGKKKKKKKKKTKWKRLNEEQIEAISNAANDLKIKKKELEEFLLSIERILGRRRAEIQYEISTFQQHFPVYRYRSQILKSVVNEDFDVTIIVAETGSGKSTLITQFLHKAKPKAKIICTQPRKLAAKSLASHVSRSLGESVVGFNFEKNTEINYVTDHSFLEKWNGDRTLKDYDYVIVDEAHERSLYTDLVLSVMKKTLITRGCSVSSNNSLKLVITSATIDPVLFVKYFDDSFKVNVINIPGKLFPVSISWGSKSLSLKADYVKATVDKSFEIFRDMTKGSQFCGNILAFLATPNDTERAQALFQEKNRKNETEVEALQLNGRLQLEEQNRIFEKTDKLRVVFATNIAETSVTIPGLVHVIDPGIHKEFYFDPKRNNGCLKLGPINKSSAQQRMGRAGRIRSGLCHRLYTEKDYKETFASGKTPEIRALPLNICLMQLFQLGFDDPYNFDFIERPDQDSMHLSLRSLLNLGAIYGDETTMFSLTELGKSISHFRMDPRLSKLLILTVNEHPDILMEALVICGMISNGGKVFYRSIDPMLQEEADEKKLEFCVDDGDFLTMLMVYKEWNRIIGRKSRFSWCRKNFINAKSMIGIHSTILELVAILRNTYEFKTKPCVKKLRLGHFLEDDYDYVRETLSRLIYETFRQNLAIYSGHPLQGYICLDTGEPITLHPGSSIKYLGIDPPKYLCFDKIMMTSRSYIIHASIVREEWLSESERNLASDPKVTENFVSPLLLGRHGKVFLTSRVIGRGGSIVKKLLSDLKNLKSFCNIDISVENGTVTAWSHPKHHATVSQHLLSHLKAAVSEFQDKFIEIPFPDKKKNIITLLIKSGGVISEPILPFDFLKVHVLATNRCTHEALSDLLKELKANITITKKNNFLVKFMTPSLARSGLDIMKKKSFCVKTFVNMKYKKTDAATFVKLKLQLQRRPPKDHAYIQFLTLEAKERFESETIFKIIRDGKVLPRQCKIRNDEGSLTRSKVQEEMERLGIQPPWIFKTVCTREFHSSEIDFNSLRDKIRSFIAKEAKILASYYEINIDQVDSRSKYWIIHLNFNCLSMGYDVGKLFKVRRPSFKYSVFCPSAKFSELTLDINSSFTIGKDVFDKIRAKIGEVLSKVNYDTEEVSANKVTIKIMSQDVEEINGAISQLQKMVKGDVLESPNMKFLSSNVSWEKCLAIQKEYNVLIKWDQALKSLSFYGEEEDILDAKGKIEDFVNDISDYNIEHTEIKFERKDGFLRKLFSFYGSSLQSLKDKYGITEVKFRFKRKEIEVVGNKEAIEGVNREVKQLLSELGAYEEEAEICCICFCEPEALEKYRFEICGHLVCIGCFRVQLNAMELPLQCSEEGCGEPLSVIDLNFGFSLEERIRSELIGTSLKKFLSETEDYFPCPTPDCNGIFRKFSLSSDLDLKRSMVQLCVLCEKDICTSCKKKPHVGYSCLDSKYLEGDTDNSLKLWMSKSRSKGKFCPKCGAPIEKISGCDHVICGKCKVHMCWRCMKTFATVTNGEGVYEHLVHCNGGSLR